MYGNLEKIQLDFQKSMAPRKRKKMRCFFKLVCIYQFCRFFSQYIRYYQNWSLSNELTKHELQSYLANIRTSFPNLHIQKTLKIAISIWDNFKIILSQKSFLFVFSKDANVCHNNLHTTNEENNNFHIETITPSCRKMSA